MQQLCNAATGVGHDLGQVLALCVGLTQLALDAEPSLSTQTRQALERVRDSAAGCWAPVSGLREQAWHVQRDLSERNRPATWVQIAGLVAGPQVESRAPRTSA